MRTFIFHICILILSIVNLSAKAFFVSSTALLNGDGSISQPWTFQKALNHPSELKPGDTVWLRGGIYKDSYDAQTAYNCLTNGTAGQPIIFRNYQDEKVVLDSPLNYTLYAALGKCSYTWFWGLEITNSYSLDRYHEITGGITCTAENMKFINLIIHDTGTGIDAWKTAKNTEIHGCIIYHIGNNSYNNGNWEGHGHGMYLQNDTFGTKEIAGNIIFSTYGYGMKVWQTTTTAPLGNFEIYDNIIFNGGSASENLGGVGNNYRTHNFFIVSNSAGNPVINTNIRHNFTFSGINMPRPPVNAFGLNYGFSNCSIESNYLMGQTRLGFNNTPVFNTSVGSNVIMGGIPSVYGYYLWGFLPTDFPNNTYLPTFPTQGLEYFTISNKYETGRNHLIIYNWDSSALVTIKMKNFGLQEGEAFELRNVMDLEQDIQTGTYHENQTITIHMKGRTTTFPIGSTQIPASQFPVFGVFLIRKKPGSTPTHLEPVTTNNLKLFPNPFTSQLKIESEHALRQIKIYNSLGQCVYKNNFEKLIIQAELDLSSIKSGFYFVEGIDQNGRSMIVRVMRGE